MHSCLAIRLKIPLIADIKGIGIFLIFDLGDTVREAGIGLGACISRFFVQSAIGGSFRAIWNLTDIENTVCGSVGEGGRIDTFLNRGLLKEVTSE